MFRWLTPLLLLAATDHPIPERFEPDLDAAAEAVWACGSCQQTHGEKMPGEPCTTYSYAARDCAQDNFQCEDTRLVCIPDPGLDEPCSLYCAGMLLCRKGICKEPADVGESCDEDQDCNQEETLYCHKGTLKCTRYGGAGEPCKLTNPITVEEPCIANFTCHEGLCVQLPDLGEPCTDEGCRDFYGCENEVCEHPTLALEGVEWAWAPVHRVDRPL